MEEEDSQSLCPWPVTPVSLRLQRGTALYHEIVALSRRKQTSAASRWASLFPDDDSNDTMQMLETMHEAMLWDNLKLKCW